MATNPSWLIKPVRLLAIFMRPAWASWKEHFLAVVLIWQENLLPLGPRAWHLNDMVAPVGMALFFTLSGFLITRFLLEHDSVVDFLIRRIFRIVPLAWLSMTVVLLMAAAPSSFYWPHFLFYANLPPPALTEVGSLNVGSVNVVCVPPSASAGALA